MDAELMDADTQPIPTALKETADGLTATIQARTLLNDAGNWLAGVKFNVPDRPMQQRIEDAAEMIHAAQEQVQEIAAILRRRVDVLRDGVPRITRGPTRNPERREGRRVL